MIFYFKGFIKFFNIYNTKQIYITLRKFISKKLKI